MKLAATLALVCGLVQAHPVERCAAHESRVAVTGAMQWQWCHDDYAWSVSYNVDLWPDSVAGWSLLNTRPLVARRAIPPDNPSELAIYNRFLAEMTASEPTSLWVVSEKRTSYPFANGRRGVQNGSAHPKSPCACRLRHVEGSAVYCDAQGLPVAYVVRCERRQ